jgi:hypothetical protein
MTGRFITFEGIDGALSSFPTLCKQDAIIARFGKCQPDFILLSLLIWGEK